MFDYRNHFKKFINKYNIDLTLSFDMPSGYESAYGTFDYQSKTVYINADLLNESPDFEKAFYLFHELRHALQYLCPEMFSKEIIRSIRYVVMYDGTCYKVENGKYFECKLDGGAERFKELYQCQPNEIDANTYAYEQVKKIYGESEDLRKIYEFWNPVRPVSGFLLEAVYDEIDEKYNKHQIT